MFFTNSQRRKAMDLLDELGKKPEETSGKNAEQYDKSDSSFFMPENKEAVTSLEADIEAEEEARAQEENGQQTLLPLLEKAQEDADDDEEEEEIEVITEDEKAKRTERYELLTGFMQHDANVISAGHYETDLHCCEMIGSHLLFPDEEVYALEPSCGSGAAMQTVCETGSVKAYGIELNRNYALEARQKDVFVDVLNDDAVANVRISKKTFGFCFANPPYGENPKRTCVTRPSFYAWSPRILWTAAYSYGSFRGSSSVICSTWVSCFGGLKSKHFSGSRSRNTADSARSCSSFARRS